MGENGMRGTNSTQDVRFSDKEKKALQKTKFPAEFIQKVDTSKVNMAIMRPWIATRTTEIVGLEDDILVNYVSEMLEDPEDKMPDPRKMQIGLAGFMPEEQAPGFMLELWKLLVSAQASIGGIPAEFLAAKKAELLEKEKKEKEVQERMLASSGRLAGGTGSSIHPAFPQQRRDKPSRFEDAPARNYGENGNTAGNGRPTRRDRSPIPRDAQGRAYPSSGLYPHPGYRRDDYRRDDRDRNGGRRDDPWRSPPRRNDRYDRRRTPSPVQPMSRRPRRESDASRDAPSRRRNGRGTLRSFSRSRSRSRERRVRKRREPTRSRSRTPPPRQRVPRREASRTPSRSRSRSRSRTPPRRRQQRSVSPEVIPKRRPARRSPSGSRSRSRSPVERQEQERGRSRSVTPPRKRMPGEKTPSRARSRSRSKIRSVTPPSKTRHLGSGNGRARQASPSRSRSRSRTPERNRDRSRSPSRSRSPVRKLSPSPNRRRRSLTPDTADVRARQVRREQRERERHSERSGSEDDRDHGRERERERANKRRKLERRLEEEKEVLESRVKRERKESGSGLGKELGDVVKRSRWAREK